MKKKAEIEREKEESETSGDDVRGGRDREKGGRKSERKRQRVLEEYRSGGWSRKRKIVKRPGVVGSFRRRYFHGDLDLRLDGPQTIEERRNMDAPPTGRVEKGRGDRGIEGAVESFSERIKARDRLVPRVTKA